MGNQEKRSTYSNECFTFDELPVSIVAVRLDQFLHWSWLVTKTEVQVMVWVEVMETQRDRYINSSAESSGARGKEYVLLS